MKPAAKRRTWVSALGIVGVVVRITVGQSLPVYWTGAPGEGFGGPAGDTDGDGTMDVALVFGLNPSVTSPQQVRIRSGLNGSLLQTWMPSVPGGWGFGVSTMDPAGDLNLDGFDDVVLNTITTTGIPTSALEVRSGLDGTVLAIIPPLAISNGTWLSSNTAGAGDLDGDGLPELLVMGNHQVLVSGCMSYGQGVYNLEAPAFGLQYYETSWQCAQEFGWQLGRIDDVDGDGNADFFIGAPQTDAGPMLDAGWIGVCSGTTGLLITSLTGVAANERLGGSVAGLDDVTGDGMPELAVVRGGLTEVAVLSLPAFTTLYALPAVSMAGTGGAILEVDALGDANGDGLDDFLVRWRTAGGSVPVPLSEGITAVSGPTGAAIGQISQNLPGAAVYPWGPLGDVNGDGLGDFAATPWVILGPVPPIAVQGLWSPWWWPMTDFVTTVYVAPNLGIAGTPTVGATAQFQVVVPKHPGRPFQLVFSQDYAFPALPIGPFLFPLAPDGLLSASLAAGMGGTLNPNGQGTVAIPIPNSPALHGAWFNASGVVYDPAGPLGIGCVLTHVGFQIP